MGDKWLVDFASCNYLGFDLDPEIMGSIDEYVQAWGTHPSWSRLLGSPVLYEQIEADLSELLDAEDTLALPTITLIHMAIIPVLAGAGTIYLDGRAHKTVYDGCQIAKAHGAAIKRFQHNDAGHLEELLQQPSSTPRLICMDGVNSMTGNTPDVRDFARLAREHEALLYIDDAHGFGVVGERSPDETSPYGMRGNGVVRHFGETYDDIVFVSGLSKSYSSLLAFVSCSGKLKDGLKVVAPPYLYSGPSPIASLATTLMGLKVNAERGDEIRADLYRKTKRVLDQVGVARHRHTEQQRVPHHRDPPGQPGGHRRRRALPVRPGRLRHARRLSAGPPQRGRVPGPADGRQHRRADRPAQRRAGRAVRSLLDPREPRAARGQRLILPKRPVRPDPRLAASLRGPRQPADIQPTMIARRPVQPAPDEGAGAPPPRPKGAASA